MNKILVIEDDLRMKELISEILISEGFAVDSFCDPRDALVKLESAGFDIVVTDLKMPHMDGIEVLEFCKTRFPDMPVILITAHGTIESAIDAIKKGAYDFIQKPFDPDQLILVVKRASNIVELLKKNRELQQLITDLAEDDLIGDDENLKKIKTTIKKVAELDVTVLIQGETGTGKELVAKLIQKNSRRKNNTFLTVNCGAIVENLLESELFGHEKGAFTGATTARKGLFETASGGTIFLDEINSTSLSFQVKLLRFLQENKILRVGSSKPVDVDVRVILASNKNLSEEVEKGTFRKDLFYRINMITINIPPLRERAEDIPKLAYYFLKKCSSKYGKKINLFDVEVLNFFKKYDWPGNVRELENVIESSFIMEETERITLKSFPEYIRSKEVTVRDSFGLMTLEEMEKFMIKKALSNVESKTKAAESLGIDPATLWRKIKKYNLE